MRTLTSLVLAAIVVTQGACAISTAQEVEMGNAYAAEINKELPLIEDAELVRYINVLGDSLARIADTRGLEWHFSIVNDSVVNAFAVPGGHIYIYRGLIEKAQSLSQVAGVMGHEIGHVTRRHSVKQMQKAQQANVGVLGICIFTNMCNSEGGQALLGLGANAAMASFSREDEDDADKVGVQYVAKAGIDPNGIPEMFTILLSLRQGQPDAVSALFASHPLEESRIEKAKARIAQLPPELQTGLTRDSPNFQAFKARLAAQPRPAAK